MNDDNDHDDDGGDDNDGDDDDYDELPHGWRPPRGGKRAQRDSCRKADSDLCRRDSELGQMLMTYGILSSQAPSVKSRLNSSRYSSA